MSFFELQSTGISAAVFLSAYAIFFIFATALVFKRGFRTMFTYLWVYSMIRIASQACGIAFAHTPNLTNLLIAYMVLNTQGFLTLIYASFRATVHEQRLKFGVSWFDTRELIQGVRFKFLSSAFALTRLILLAGSIVAIVGGVEMAGASPTDPNFSGEVKLSRDLRIAGSVLLLVGTLILIFLAIFAFTQEHIRTVPLKLVNVAAPFFLVRCVYNFLAIFVTHMNFFNFENYLGSDNRTLVLSESVMSTLMEFIICLLMTAAFLTTVHAHNTSESNRDSGDEKYDA
ncbi:hypothetical protein PUMCH_000735 [Australozyma saopauloensis]|uniref:DUF7702 domain-containing protein n=1 Tax=Australozyma saopauloensis TaxID=291208 RepID=A0AAX4H4R1_9ASCO|nr:hypothetical protein PUMCH_000735 [[Candida] saopauloensis]